MMEHGKHTDEGRSSEKRPFVKPELRREAKLPEITNAFVGSFDPDGDSTQQP